MAQGQAGGPLTAAGETTYLIVPDNRGIFRTDAIESVAVYVPRQSFIDEVTGKPTRAILMVETRRNNHRFNMASVEEAQDVVAAAGLQLAGLTLPAGTGEDAAALPEFLQRRRLPEAAQ